MSGGFGSTRFGSSPFGRAPWARAVRYGLLPSVHRNRDAEEGYPLLRYVEGLAPLYEGLRQSIQRFPDLRDPLRVQGQYTHQQTVTLGPSVVRLAGRSQTGVDGRVLPLRVFEAPSARFTAGDRGSVLTVRSSLLTNNREVRIALVVSSTTVLTEPPLDEDAGPLSWDVRALASELPADHVVLEVQSGDPLAVRPGWLLYDGVAEFEVVGRRVFPDRTDPPVAPLSRHGQDGSIDGVGLFSSPTLRAMPMDVGVPLYLYDSTYTVNRGRFLVSAVLSSETVRLTLDDGSAASLVEDSGPLMWAFLPRPQIIVRGPSVPLGLEEQRGTDLTIGSSGVTVLASAPSVVLSASDALKSVTLCYPDGPRLATISEVLSASTCFLTSDDGLDLAAGANLVWRLRSVPQAVDGDRSKVLLRAPSLLPALAGDFGLTVDRQEGDLRQRSWVRHVAAWTRLKGAAQSYAAVGSISGARAEAKALYRVSQEIGLSLPLSYRVELQEWETGRHGLAGAIGRGTAGVVRFTDSTATFSASDVGRQLHLTSGGAHSENRTVYTIARVLNARAVEFRPSDVATLPDDGFVWYLSRYYATQPPQMARFDEINADLMETLVDGVPPQTADAWGIDRYCWEEGTVESVSVTVASSSALGSGRFQVTVEGRADVVVSVGRWKLVDSLGRSFFLETVPAEVDPMTPSFEFEVATVFAPETGSGDLVYVCDTILSCDYCGAAKVQLSIEEIPAEVVLPSDVERFHARVLSRVAEVTPAHVTVVPLLTASAEVALGGDGLSVSLEVS